MANTILTGGDWREIHRKAREDYEKLLTRKADPRAGTFEPLPVEPKVFPIPITEADKAIDAVNAKLDWPAKERQMLDGELKAAMDAYLQPAIKANEAARAELFARAEAMQGGWAGAETAAQAVERERKWDEAHVTGEWTAEQREAHEADMKSRGHEEWRGCPVCKAPRGKECKPGCETGGGIYVAHATVGNAWTKADSVEKIPEVSAKLEEATAAILEAKACRRFDPSTEDGRKNEEARKMAGMVAGHPNGPWFDSEAYAAATTKPILGGVFEHAEGCRAPDYGPCSCGPRPPYGLFGIFDKNLGSPWLKLVRDAETSLRHAQDEGDGCRLPNLMIAKTQIEAAIMLLQAKEKVV